MASMAMLNNQMIYPHFFAANPQVPPGFGNPQAAATFGSSTAGDATGAGGGLEVGTAWAMDRPFLVVVI